EIALAQRIVERAGAKSVARQQDRTITRIVERDRELALQPLQYVATPFYITRDQDLGRTPLVELMTQRFQLADQLPAVEELPGQHPHDSPVHPPRQRRLASPHGGGSPMPQLD